MDICPQSICDVITYIYDSYKKLTPHFIQPAYIYFQPKFQHFPQFESGLDDLILKRHITQTKQGKLITFQNAYILKISQQAESFLWRQTFKIPCECKGDYETSIDITHNLHELLKLSLNIASSKLQSQHIFKQKCTKCMQNYTEDQSQRIYIPYSKLILVFPDSKDSDMNSFSKQFVPCWVSSASVISQFQQGDYVSGVAYYDVNLNFSNTSNERMLGSFKDILIACQITKSNKQVPQIKLIKKLLSQKENFDQKISIEKLIQDKKGKSSQFSGFIRDNYDTIATKWVLFKFIQQFLMDNSVSYLELNYALIMSIIIKQVPYIISVASQSSTIRQYQERLGGSSKDLRGGNSINLFAFTDDINLIIKQMEGIMKFVPNIASLPSFFDNETLVQFLVNIDGGFLVVYEPKLKSKKEQEIINKLLRKQEIFINDSYGSIKINCTLWIFASDDSLTSSQQQQHFKTRDPYTLKDYCPFQFDCFDIALDLSRRNSMCKGIAMNQDLQYANNLLERFQNLQLYDNNEQDEEFKQIKKDHNEEDFIIYSRELILNSAPTLSQEENESYRLCQEFMKAFYVSSRKIKEMSIGDFDSLFKIVNANYIVREAVACNSVEQLQNLQKLKASNNENIEFIDVLIAIIFSDLSTLAKFGSESSILGANCPRMFQYLKQELIENKKDNFDEDVLRNFRMKSDEQFFSIYDQVMSFLQSFTGMKQQEGEGDDTQ